jgi:hypothetical protein
MKFFLPLVASVLFGLVALPAGAATINATNYNIDTLTHKPITLTSGLALTSGGVIQLGSFQTNDLSALIAGLTSPAGLNALLADFIAFGSSTTIGGQGAGFEGIYDLPAQTSLATGNSLIGKSIYTLIGNNAALASSTNLLIVKHPGVFEADAPLFVGSASLLDPANQVLFGNASGPVVSANSVFPAAVSLQFPVPEPMSASLVVCALALAGRRRRAAQFP